MKPYQATPEQVDRFRAEAAEHRLEFRCDACIHAVPSTLACSLEYPNRTLLEASEYLEQSGHFVFCKYFEAS